MRQASPARLLEVARAHWGIEGGLHQRRDVSLGEDRGQTRTGHAPQVLASLNNLVIGIVAHAGQTNLAAAQRGFAYRFDKAMHTANATSGARAVPAGGRTALERPKPQPLRQAA